MTHKNLKSLMLLLVMGLFTLTSAAAQELQKEYDTDEQQMDRPEGEDYYDRVRIDRYLNVEIWTDHEDDEYYEGDRVKFYFRVSRDAFVAIYSIDSKGRVNLLFPGYHDQDNYVTGGVTHSLPGRNDDYDLIVNGPDGVENVQIIASREPFPIPDWYDNSGLFCDWDDRHEYMDWVNGQYFVKYDGQRFAYDRTALYVYEWEPNYFRPIYRPYYPNWTVCGNVYVDYWPGSSIYIDGIFWGITPCYIPRIYVGWHTFTIYDYYNYCWEYDVHVTRYNTVVLDQTIIVTQPTVRSKFKTVRFAGYQEPTKAGYADFDNRMKVIKNSGAWKTESAGKIVVNSKEVERTKVEYTAEKKFVQGSAKVVKTERGIESAGAPVERGQVNSKSRKYNTSGTIERKGSEESGHGQVSRSGKMGHQDSNGQTESGTKSGTIQERKGDTNKKSGSASKHNSDNSSSGSYKKTSNDSSKKESSSKQSDKSGNESKGEVKQKESPSQSQPKQESGGKKPHKSYSMKSQQRDQSEPAFNRNNVAEQTHRASKNIAAKNDRTGSYEKSVKQYQSGGERARAERSSQQAAASSIKSHNQGKSARSFNVDGQIAKAGGPSRQAVSSGKGGTGKK